MSVDFRTTPQETLVRRHFNAHADQWDEIYGRNDLHSMTIRNRREKVLTFVDRLELRRGARVLDLGCGAGLTAVALAERGFRVVGVDVSANMVQRSRDNCASRGLSSRTSFQVGDAEGLDFEDGAFGVVIAMGLIEYLRWDRWALQEMRRVLNPGGHLIVTVPNRDRLSHRVARLSAVAEDRLKYYVSRVRAVLSGSVNWAPTSSAGGVISTPPAFTRRLYTPDELRAMLRRLDFEIVDSVSHGFGPFGPLARSDRLSVLADRLLDVCKDRGVLPMLADSGSNTIVLCRKPAQPDPNATVDISQRLEQRVRRFESDHRELLARRDAWLRKHAIYAGGRLRTLDEETGLPERVLVLAPHPDDEIIGCGGTLAKLIDAGSSVTVLYVTDGSGTAALDGMSETVRREIRVREANEVAQRMRFAEAILWGEPEKGLRCTAQRVADLRASLERVKPEMVFVPFVDDPHPDHRTVNAMLGEALRTSGAAWSELRVAGYEVWSLVPANLVCVIDDHEETKARMLMHYRTAMKCVDYVHRCEVLSAHHARSLLGRRGFAEAFFELDGGAYASLVGLESSDNVDPLGPQVPEDTERSST